MYLWACPCFGIPRFAPHSGQTPSGAVRKLRKFLQTKNFYERDMA